MGSYFDYVIERKVGSNWYFVAKSTYEDNEAINPYILKGLFWDTEFQECVPDDISSETKTEFYERIGVYDKKELEGLKSATKTLTNPIAVHDKMRVADVLEYLRKHYSTKFRETLIRVDLDGIVKYWNNVKTFLRFKDADQVDVSVEKLKSWIKNGLIENLIETKYGYQLVCESPYAAIMYIRDYGMLKGIENPSEILVGEVCQFSYIDENEKEIPQYRLKRSARCSTTKDIDLMIDDLKADIERVKKSNTLENVVRDEIRNLVNERATEEDKNTNLYKELMSYCGEEEVYGDEEYLQELEDQLHEVEKIRAIMGPAETGRIIWRIE